MALLGQLNEFHLQHIIGLLQVERQTGELALECDGQRVSLYFHEGAIVHAVAGAQSGYPAALVPFDWQHGKFHFEGYDPPIEPTITTPNAAIVSAGQRRAVEAVEVRACVPSPYMLVRLMPQAEGQAGSINLSFEDWRFLTLVDGRHDLHTIARSLRKDDFEVQVLATRLIKAGLIEALDRRLTMIRMVAMPTTLDLRPPANPQTALMDDMALDMLRSRARNHPTPVRAEVLSATNRLAVVTLEGRPDLADRLLLSPVVMAQLAVERNTLLHLRLLDE
ncbi:MAG: DUF4388 domain-containing protein [Chloroflexota bacterium]|nr:DUF4388 domain-containing protein [Chloroflexota bacterium]